MKRNFFFLVLSLLFVSNTLWAQKNEFGLLLGGMNGLSYKHIVSNDFAIQTDLAIGFQRTIATEGICSDLYNYTIDIFDFALNANFLYNKELQNNIYMYAGGGPNIGLVEGLPHSEVTFGKFGANVVLGVGYKMSNLPLTFSLDFRPGYAFLLNYNYEMLLHILDWHLSCGVRYCF